MLPEPIKKFISAFSKLPSIGPRQATRLAFYLISRGKGEIFDLAQAIANLQSIKLCSDCYFIHHNEGSLCSICENPHRDKTTVMIVEKETDITSIERTGKFTGRYLVLGELTKSGNLENYVKARLENLKGFIAERLNGQAKEIIIATNPTTYGDLNASIIRKELEGLAQKFTRLGRGIPTGGEIEFADEETISHALERRI